MVLVVFYYGGAIVKLMRSTPGGGGIPGGPGSIGGIPESPARIGGGGSPGNPGGLGGGGGKFIFVYILLEMLIKCIYKFLLK